MKKVSATLSIFRSGGGRIGGLCYQQVHFMTIRITSCHLCVQRDLVRGRCKAESEV
jgi:hypothetical protein